MIPTFAIYQWSNLSFTVANCSSVLVILYESLRTSHNNTLKVLGRIEKSFQSKDAEKVESKIDLQRKSETNNIKLRVGADFLILFLFCSSVQPLYLCTFKFEASNAV